LEKIKPMVLSRRETEVTEIGDAVNVLGIALALRVRNNPQKGAQSRFVTLTNRYPVLLKPVGSATQRLTVGKPSGQPNQAGTNGLPLFVAQLLPDGSTHFDQFNRNVIGKPTSLVSTWNSQAGGTVGTRTNTFVYSPDAVDLVRWLDPMNNQVSSNLYNSLHLVATNWNANNEITTYQYDSAGRITNVLSPTGLTTTYQYYTSTGTNSDNVGYLQQVADVGFRTNSFGYSKGLVSVQTNELGTAVTNSWDNLQRLVGRQFWDGTTISNIYYKRDGTPFANSSGGTNLLDLTGTKDRLGNWTYFNYDSMRHLTAAIDPLSHTNAFNYYLSCSCGSLDSISYPTGDTNSFTYDNLGQLQTITVSRQGSISYSFNLLGQLTSVTSYGDTRNLYYSNQGLPSAATNTVGQLLGIAYDILDRATNVVDANGVAVTNSYDVLNRVLARGLAQTNSNEYFGYTLNVAGPTAYTNQINNKLTFAYDALGRRTNETYVGVTTNSFTYDPQSNLATLIDGKSHPTTWVYDQEGRLKQKTDAANASYTFGYFPTGWLSNRVDSMNRTTSYTYDSAGNLRTVYYASLNKTLSYAYDVVNRLQTMGDDIGTTSFSYALAGPFSRLNTETPPWVSSAVTHTYSFPSMVPANMQVSMPDSSSLINAYTFSAGRLQQLTSSIGSSAYPLAGTFTYTYQGAGNLIRNIALGNGAFITNRFDTVGRLAETRLNNASSATLNVHQYGYNAAHQRTFQTNFFGNYWNFGYDAVSELINATGYDTASTNRLQERFGYGYDVAGNLAVRTNGEMILSFAVNNLNELTSVNRTTSYMTVAGTTTSAASSVNVADNGNPAQPATRYYGSAFARANVPVLAGNNTFTATATDSYGRGDTNTATINLPLTVSPSYDPNGNLLSDGLRTMTYDQENQLTSVIVTNSVNNSTRTDFIYDGLFRLRIRREWTWQSTGWAQLGETHYLYDGRVVIQERDINNVPLLTYTRGSDFSGTQDGAGGVGGLLARTDHSALVPTEAYYHADGVGSVTTLINGQQVVVARYSYDPFGNLLAKSGPLADANVYRFSSKEYHGPSGLYYFAFRWYDPNLQRWINRDPLRNRMLSLHSRRTGRTRMFPGEVFAGPNLYAYVGNIPLNAVDPYGLINWPEVGGGVLTTVGGVGSIIGGALWTGGTEGAGAVFGGGAAMFAGGTSVGLGLTAIFHGFKDNGPVKTPTGGVPQGFVECLGAATGNPNLQSLASLGDTAASFALPPKWGGPVSLLNNLLNPPSSYPNSWPLYRAPVDQIPAPFRSDDSGSVNNPDNPRFWED
jgi:RHS repeat-associated protein